MTLNDYESKVINWAKNRGILEKSTPEKQLIKCYEELGELSEGLLKSNDHLFKDGVGDTLVTLILLCNLKGTDLTECLHYAYTEIANREGKMVNGVFVKNPS